MSSHASTSNGSSSEQRRSDPLLQPFAVAGMRLRNRVVSTSHEPAYTVDGMPKERYRAYHVEKARGGVGLTMIGGSAVVSPDSPPAFGNIEMWREEVVPWLRTLTEEVHSEGAAVMIQLTHLGRRSSNFSGDWLPLVYAGSSREPAHRSYPKAAEAWDLDRIVADYAAAAGRCREAGLDGIELEAYGHLIDGFLSPATNQRDDAFGGDALRRREFPLRVIRAVREAMGPDAVLCLRMSMDECLANGFGPDEAVAAVNAFAEEGVQLLSVIRGTIESDATLAKVIPSMGARSAPHLEFAGEIRSRVTIPVMHAAMIGDVATARHALTAGLVDLVGLTRPQMADPHLVAKVARGEADRIRPCVGANYCLDAIYESGAATCIHNPATGRELHLPQVITRPEPPERPVRRAVVIGAGVAGLEAARVLAERGHHVSVLEAADAPGGQVRLAAAAPRRRDLIAIVDWRVAELDLLGVKVHYGRYAEADDIRALHPDLVVVATGGLPNVQGHDHVLDTWDVLSGAQHPTGSVLVYDDHGLEAALGATELLAERGCRVELVTPERTVGIGIGGMNSPGYLAAFAEHDVAITLATRLRNVALSPDGRGRVVTLGSDYTDRTWRREVDAVIVEHGTVPNDDLYTDLIEGSSNRGEVDQAALLAGQPQALQRNPEGTYQLFRIGDAVTSRNIHAAIYDALRLCAPL